MTAPHGGLHGADLCTLPHICQACLNKDHDRCPDLFAYPHRTGLVTVACDCEHTC
jgi:hypothetical protein